MATNHSHQLGASNSTLALRYRTETVSPYHGLVRELLAGSIANPQVHSLAPVVGITSASHRAGVTTITAKLGVSAAEIVTRPALLIDCHATAPDLLAALQVPLTCGLKDILTGEETLSDCVFPTRIRNLHLLGPGIAAVERKKSEGTQSWQELLQNAKRLYGIVLLDLPPVSELLSEVSSLQGIDRLLLVVEAERTRRQAVVRAQSQLQRVGAELSGIVLNKHRKHIPEWIYRRI